MKNERKKLTNIGKPLKFHCFLRIHTHQKEHREHTCEYACVVVCVYNIYRLHLFCLISINVRTRIYTHTRANENEKKKYYKETAITNFNDSFRPPKETEFNTKKIFVSFVLFHYFYCTIVFFERKKKLNFILNELLFFLLVCERVCISFQTTRMISIQYKSLESHDSNVPFGTTFESLLTTQANIVVTRYEWFSQSYAQHIQACAALLLLLPLLLLLLLSIHTAATHICMKVCVLCTFL